MALQVWNGFAQDTAGNVLASPTVEVRDESDNSLASLFEDRAGATPLGNPYTAPADGQIAFYVQPGRYKITATKGAETITFRNELVGYEPAELVPTVATLAELQGVSTAGFTGGERRSRSESTSGDGLKADYIFRAGDQSASVAAKVGSEWVVPTDRTADGSDGAWEQVADVIHDRFAPAFLKTISDINQGLPVNPLVNISKTLHASIKDFSSSIDVSTQLNELIDDGDIREIKIPYGRFVLGSPLGVATDKKIQGAGMEATQLYFATKAFEQINGALPARDMAASISDLYLLGDTGAAPTRAIDVARVWGVDWKNIRIRESVISVNDFAGVQCSYDNLRIEGRFILTGTRTTDLGTDNKVSRLKQVWTQSNDAGILVQNNVNTIFSVVHQNAPVNPADPDFSATREGLRIIDQCEGVFIDHLQSVGMGYGFVVDDTDGGAPPLACKLHHSIIDQYVTAGGVIQNCSGFQEVDNTYSYQISDAGNGVSTVIGSEALRYKQTANTYLETQLEAILIQNGSQDTDIYGVDCENSGQKTANTYADIRVEANTTRFHINGIDASGSQHSQAINIQSGSSNEYSVRDVKCVGNSIAAVTDGGSGTDKYVESGVKKFGVTADFTSAASALNRDALTGDQVFNSSTGATLTKSNTGTTQPWRSSDGTIVYTPS